MTFIVCAISTGGLSRFVKNTDRSKDRKYLKEDKECSFANVKKICNVNRDCGHYSKTYPCFALPMIMKVTCSINTAFLLVLTRNLHTIEPTEATVLLSEPEHVNCADGPSPILN